VQSDPAADASRGVSAITHEITAKLNKPLVTSHPSFSNGRIFVASGETVIVYLIRLYEEGTVEGFLAQAGFEVIESRTPPPANSRSRRFSYVVARKVS
jgi:hypothetical protein